MKKNIKTGLSLFIAMLFAQLNYAQTVTIGKQVWTTKNLNVDKFRNGDPIPQAKTDEEWERASDNNQPAWCYHDNDTNNGEKYGKLYNWYAVNDPRGLAPLGYHIPTDAEWSILTDYLGAEGATGGKMKATSGWRAPNKEASNSSGFSGLPGSCRIYNGTFTVSGKGGYWWSSSEYYKFHAWNLYLGYDDGNVTRHYTNEGCGFSVRCLRD